MSVKRGDIYYADLSPVVGSEQGGLRPVLIIQNDVGNKYSPTVIAAAITSRLGKTRLPTHIDVYADRVGLARDSVILLEQMRTLDKRRLKEKMGHLDEGMMQEVNRAIAVSVGLGDWQSERGGAEHRVAHTPTPAVAATASPAVVDVPLPLTASATVYSPETTPEGAASQAPPVVRELDAETARPVSDTQGL
jgi:mRNA interferase MazF